VNARAGKDPSPRMEWMADIGPAARMPRESAGAPATRAAVRVLIVDDSPAVRDGLSAMLRANGAYEVAGAVGDAAAALRCAVAAAPDVVLLDLSMPGVDPLALVRDLRALSPAPAVVVLTAFGDKRRIAAAIAAGAVGWLLKDAAPEELFAALAPFAGAPSPVVPHAEPPDEEWPDAPLPSSGGLGLLDARTCRALLRALHGSPAPLDPAEVGARAVLAEPMARRALARLAARRPPLVEVAGGDEAEPLYVLTPAGEAELCRLERHVGDAAAGDAP
jgi:CheY-like chemotaxis protein